MTTPDQYVEQKVAAAGSSFYYAFRFLPPAPRSAITAFYAFCRKVDDIADTVTDGDVAAAKLNWWRGEVRNTWHGQPSHPVMQALAPHISTFDLQAAHLLDVIEGCQSDLRQRRYADFESLRQYCDLVAGVVGEVSARIFGASDEATMAYAHHLGLALQLTNIIRDVGEDARRDRIYLPAEDLHRFGVSESDILSGTDSAAFRELMAFQAQRAHRIYDEALALLPDDARGMQKPGLMMASIYRNLLREIEASDFAVLHQRIALTPLRKLWLAWKIQALGRF